MATHTAVLDQTLYTIKVNRPGECAPKAWQVDIYKGELPHAMEYVGQFTNYHGTSKDALRDARRRIASKMELSVPEAQYRR